MISIYEQALGSEFRKLHPKVQERFGFSSKDGIASIGHGVMERIWYAKWAALPLRLGQTRHIMFPRGGTAIPFSIDNYAYRDAYGRETVTWCRKFKFPEAIRSFDATMIYSEDRQKIVDYLGTKQHLAVDLEMTVRDDGGIQIRSGEQRFYEGPLGFRFPPSLTGIANVCEWYDDREQTFKISVNVTNPLIGPVFRYHGRFQARFERLDAAAFPLDIKPLREERRE
ncbi:DUF4166 domain-containing protein [Cohnella boryungensis]|uniref:DUF4166 domain-containing protein n=1 Tax=Cohnella boryungensis TaxID=768479 RepID=A0ABV8SEE8_9BACL